MRRYGRMVMFSVIGWKVRGEAWHQIGAARKTVMCIKLLGLQQESKFYNKLQESIQGQSIPQFIYLWQQRMRSQLVSYPY